MNSLFNKAQSSALDLAMPVGNEAVPELMVSAQQRKFMYEQVRKFWETKPIFTLDFWNDGEYSEGCLAGGRVYLHINAGGDYAPCAFIHYSDTSIRTHTLLETLQAPLFTAYKNGQLWNKNHLRPCPLLDNPQALVDAVERSGAHSTDMQSPEDVRSLAGKCTEKAAAWAEVADDLWACSHDCAGCNHKKLHENRWHRAVAAPHSYLQRFEVTRLHGEVSCTT